MKLYLFVIQTAHRHTQEKKKKKKDGNSKIPSIFFKKSLIFYSRCLSGLFVIVN